MAQLLFTISFAFCHFISMSSSLNQEGIALLSFKQSLQNHSDTVLTDWNSSDSDPCSWNGVSCNNELTVVSLSLPNKRLSGSLHPSLGTLLSLRHVNLRNNLFHGTLPVELFQAKGLQSLVLSRNSFSGFVPSEIGRLKSLQSLDVSENSLNGSIPLSLMRCERLRTLVLSRNSFSGDLAYGFGSSLVHLQTLNLSFNGFTGLIPEDIGNLMNLRGVLDLSHNFFSGEIPKSLGDLPETVYVDLSYNNLTGPIPKTEVLLNAGPNAFEGNPQLCGLPLKISCSERNIPIIPSDLNSRQVHHHSSVSIIIAATLGTAAGISLVSLLLAYYLRKASSGTRTCCLEEKLKVKKEFLCFKNKDLETEASLQEGMNQKHVFVGMDPELDFNLEQLLKASAFLLGNSGIGIVYKVVLETGLTLAVRRLEYHGSDRLKDFLAEVEAMGKIKHPNLVNLRACCWSPEEKLLIYDYIPNGDLASAIHGRSGNLQSKQLSWPVRLTIMRGIARGLAYIHKFSPKRYVHGHLCPANILLGENLEPKISGFGLGRIQLDQNSPYDSSDSPKISRKCHYQAPEASQITKPSQRWDVYSFGLVVLEMVTGKSPVLQTDDGSETDLVMWVDLAIERSKPVWHVLDPVLARYGGMEESVVEVIKIGMACVHKSPDRRPSMRQVLESFENLA